MEPRIVIAKLVMTVHTTLMREYFPNGRAAAWQIPLCAALMAADRPLRAATLCRQVGLPRNTCLRKLAALIEMGAIAHENGAYRIRHEYFDRKLIRGKLIEAVRAAAHDLSKMDKNI